MIDSAITTRDAFLESLFKKAPAMSQTSKKVFGEFLNSFNPDKGRFKDKGHQEAFRRVVAPHAEELKQEYSKHVNDEGLIGAFWNSVKKSLPLEVAYRRESLGSVLRRVARSVSS